MRQTQTQYFEGWYFKHTKAKNMLALIPGVSRNEKGKDNFFLQVITKDKSYYITYNSTDCYISYQPFFIRLKHSYFSKQGVTLCIDTKDLSLHGTLFYGELSKLSYGIMGPFEVIPWLECYHEVISMNHSLHGTLHINQQDLSFHEGNGYIEADRGTSFPSFYRWTQCNAFPHKKVSIFASVADVMACRFHFTGTIAVVKVTHREYRLASYLGARVLHQDDDTIILRQGRYELQCYRYNQCHHPLYAPVHGNMKRIVYENAVCTVRYRFLIHDHVVFDELCDMASFESSDQYN